MLSHCESFWKTVLERKAHCTGRHSCNTRAGASAPGEGKQASTDAHGSRGPLLGRVKIGLPCFLGALSYWRLCKWVEDQSNRTVPTLGNSFHAAVWEVSNTICLFVSIVASLDSEWPDVKRDARLCPRCALGKVLRS